MRPYTVWHEKEKKRERVVVLHVGMTGAEHHTPKIKAKHDS